MSVLTNNLFLFLLINISNLQFQGLPGRPGIIGPPGIQGFKGQKGEPGEVLSAFGDTLKVSSNIM